MYYAKNVPSPLGTITLASDGDAIVGLWFQNQKYYLDSLPQAPLFHSNQNLFHSAEMWLNQYFSGQNPSPKQLSIHPIGSPFRQLIWKLLLEIPYGSVTTYGALAAKAAAALGRNQMSAQAVGGAVGHNPISIVIPCHRVVGVDGSLTGYAGGIWRKKELLRREGAQLPPLW